MAARSARLSGEQRRAQTVRTVIELAGRLNPQEITTARIAQAMGLTQGALFRHFPDKDTIWRAVMEWVADHLLDRIDRAAAGASGCLDALEAIFLAHVDFVVRHPGVPRMLFGELQRAEPTPARAIAGTLLERYAARLAEIMERGKARDELDPGLDVEAAAALFLGMLQGLVMQSLLSGRMDHIRELAPRAFAIFRNSLERPS